VTTSPQGDQLGFASMSAPRSHPVTQNLNALTEDRVDTPDETEKLADALREADIPVLLMVLFHLTGDQKWLSDRLRPAVDKKSLFRDPAGGLSRDAQDEVREAALVALSDYFGHPRSLALPSISEFHEMLTFCAGENVPREYVEMVLEEMGLQSREVDWRTPPDSKVLQEFHVIVVGAGLSGLCAAIKMERLGIRYTIVEKNPNVGGTWFENSYPGCAVDVANHFYSYSFEPRPDWTHYFSKRDELLSYFEHCAASYGIDRNIRFNHEVVSAEYSSTTQTWTAQVRGPDDQLEQLTGNVIISAVGQLNRPKVPEIPGLNSHDVPVFHSSQWQHDIDLKGKRVAVVGTGASAMQLVPAIASEVDQLLIFQRTPIWTIPNPDYQRTVTDATKWLLRNVPFYAGWYRFSLLWALGDSLWPLLQIDPDWPSDRGTINAANDRARGRLTQYLVSQVGDRTDLLEKVIPDYAPYAKRMLIDNGWIDTLKRPNVELVTSGISEVSDGSIVTDDGLERQVDVIILATGFEATKLLHPMEIRGKSGRPIAETWDEDNGRAYLGIAVPDYPNLFLLYGPNTNLGHGGSIIFHTECQTRYVMSCLRELVEGGHRAMEVRQEAHDAYNAQLDEALAKMIWQNVDRDSWYKNTKGRVVTNSPWRLVDYWSLTKTPDLGSYTLMDSE
jgi:4-hydroxyacetophenone monooxygenase